MNNTNLRDLDDGIGIDPTTVEVIESLNGPTPSAASGKPSKKKGKVKKGVPNKSTNNKKKKQQAPLSTVIMVAVACLVLVGGGIYFYLHLGNKDGGGGLFGGGKQTYKPDDKIITVGDTLSLTITDYGSFPGVDLKSCKLDISGVDVNTVGTYPFTVTCGSDVFTANVNVLEEPDFIYTPILTYVSAGNDVDPYSLFTANDNYGAEFPDPDYLKTILKNDGVHRIDLRLINSYNQSGIVNAYIVVSNVQYADVMTCASKELTNADKKYTITDTVYFDQSSISIKTIRNYAYIISEDEIASIKESIKEDGTITYDGKNGYALFDRVNNVLQIVKDTSDGIMQTSEITKTKQKKADLENYYKTTKGYTCN